MNLKNIALFALFCALVVAFWWRRSAHPLPLAILVSDVVRSKQSNAETTASNKNQAEPIQRGTTIPSQTIDSQRTGQIQSYVTEVQADALYDFKVPMRFYGKVLDENAKAIGGADIHFEWNNLTPTNDLERKAIESKTDEQGLFSFEGQNGKRLNVVVNKTGFYNSKQNPLAFEFADPSSGAFYTPDQQNPVIFRLRKKGLGVPLITSKNGMRPSVKLSVPMNGTANVDLLNQKVAESGPLQVSQTKPTNIPWQEASAWSFRMTIPDGGFVASNEEYPFEAPEQGYQPTVQFDFQKDSTNWTTGVKRDFFVRFGNPPTYGLLHVETTIDEAGARLTYAINPDGSRNLESQ